MSNALFTSLPAEHRPDPIAELALDLRWSWNHSTDERWRKLEPELWEGTRNPWLTLQSVSREKLESLLRDPGFREQVDALIEKRRSLERSGAWFQKAHSDSALHGVAYF